jgi:hypothetical protein
MILALEHHFYPALVFEPARFGVDADFPSVSVHSDGSVQNGLVVLGEFWAEFEARDRATAHFRLAQFL